MKTDLYTKIVLTVIALALTINLVKDFTFVTPAQAAVAPIPEPAAVQSSGVVDVNIVQIDGEKIQRSSYRGSLPVVIWSNTDK